MSDLPMLRQLYLESMSRLFHPGLPVEKHLHHEEEL